MILGIYNFHHWIAIFMNKTDKIFIVSSIFLFTYSKLRIHVELKFDSF